MTIKTWQQRQAETGIGSIQAKEDEIDELRAALAERDAEIERLKTVPMKYRRMAFNAELQDEVVAQRRVLEQALEALEQSRIRTVSEWEVNEITPRIVTEAITAIQEVLK